MSKRRIGWGAAFLFAVYFVVAVLPGDGPAPAGAEESSPAPGSSEAPPAAVQARGVRYLTFQVFTDERPKLWQGFDLSDEGKKTVVFETVSKADVDRTVRGIVEKIGTTGSAQAKLGFTIGPIALEYDDAQIQAMIRDAFEIARTRGVAVGFHVDDSMFWSRRKDLWSKLENIEWLDWKKTPSTGRRLDWGDPPRKLAPQMCYNAPAIQAEIRRVGRDVVGAEVQRGRARLEAEGKGDLFAGVIVGWETQLAKDAETNRTLGYCALTNLGHSAGAPPPDLDAAREQVVRAFIDLWADAVASSGVPPEKIYAHTAFTSRQEHAEMVKNDRSRNVSYSETVNFAPPSVAFGPKHNPGFSTYPSPGLYQDLWAELARHGNPRWASAEGTNVRTGMRSGETSMETYLARHFNHGASLVNVFAWGVAGEDDPWRRATERDESIAAYRKFLRGEALAEAAVPTNYGLPAKIEVIQRELPRWLQTAPNKERAADLMEEMMGHVKKNQPWKAEEVADRILELIGAAPGRD